MEKIKEFLRKLFLEKPEDRYHFYLADENTMPQDDAQKESVQTPEATKADVKNIFPSIDVNLEYVKVKYNAMINSDVVIREFILTARNRQYRAFLLFIDGMVDTDLINNYVLKPLMMKNQANSHCI